MNIGFIHKGVKLQIMILHGHFALLNMFELVVYIDGTRTFFLVCLLISRAFTNFSLSLKGEQGRNQLKEVGF